MSAKLIAMYQRPAEPAAFERFCGDRHQAICEIKALA